MDELNFWQIRVRGWGKNWEKIKINCYGFVSRTVRPNVVIERRNVSQLGYVQNNV